MPSVTLFSINYKKTHKSQLKCEIKHDLYKISPKKLKNLKKRKFCTFQIFKVFKNLKNVVFFEAIF